jgi:hypothetical protein
MHLATDRYESAVAALARAKHAHDIAAAFTEHWAPKAMYGLACLPVDCASR